MMIPYYDSVITGAGTDADGELRIWRSIGINETGHILFSDKRTKGVYALSISPSGRYLAAGSKVGLIRLWPFPSQSHPENTPPLFEVYHQLCPVTSLTFLTDDILLSAGANGKIRLISIPEQHPIGDLDAHRGAICSIVALGNRVVTSLGIDGKLKIWDLDSRACEFEMEGFLFPRDSLNLFPVLAFAADTGYICAPSMEGRLHLINLRDECRHETLTAHDGIFYAVATSGEYVITSGMKDKMLRLWDLRKRSLVHEEASPSAILRLAPVGKEKIAALCIGADKTQTLRLFSFPQFRQMGAVKNLSLRSLASLPPKVVEELKRNEATVVKNRLIEQAQAEVSDPDKMKPMLNELVKRGFWAEAKLLQAESARLRGKPLHELGFLRQLTTKISISQDTAGIFHRLAELLEMLNEPELAIENYEKITSYQEGISEVIEKLQVHSTCRIDPCNTIRSDLSTEQLVVQEIEKDSVLERPFQWRVIIPVRELNLLRIRSLKTLELWETSITEKISSKDRSVSMAQENVTFCDGRRTRKTRWLNISQIGLHAPSPLLDYAIEIMEQTGHVSGYCIFNPNKKSYTSDNVIRTNALLAREYRLLNLNRQRPIENWVGGIHKTMKELDRYASCSRS